MKTLLSSTLLLIGLAWPAAAIPVTNPGFETGTLAGWTQFGNTGFSGVDGNLPHSGSFAAFFGNGSPGGISQDLATTIGQTYQISFWLAQEAGASNSFSSSFGSTAGPSLTNASAFAYTLFTFSAIATAPVTTLSFTFTNPPIYWDLDDISVEADAPELNGQAACAPLLLVGLLVLAARREKKQVF